MEPDNQLSIEWELARMFRTEMQDRLHESPELHRSALNLIRQRLSVDTIDALGTAKQQFFCCHSTNYLTVIYGKDKAIICHARQWNELDNYCKAAYEVTGITHLIFAGSDLYILVRREAGQWIRESIGTVGD